LRINECVTDALRRNRIAVVARVTDERPPVSKRLAEESGHACRAVPLLLTTALAHTGTKVGRRLESPPDVCFDIAADSRKVLGSPVHHQEMETIVCRRTPKCGVVTHV